MTASGEPPHATFAFEADVFHWRGPSPYFFVALPPAEAKNEWDIFTTTGPLPAPDQPLERLIADAVGGTCSFAS